MSSLKQTLVQTSGLLAALAASDSSNISVVTTDTLVIGGGAGGAHAAVRLTDYGQDVILVERQPILVGFSFSKETIVLDILNPDSRVVPSTVSQIPLRERRMISALETLRIMATPRDSLLALIFPVSNFTRKLFCLLAYPRGLRGQKRLSLKQCHICDTLLKFGDCFDRNLSVCKGMTVFTNDL